MKRISILLIILLLVTGCNKKEEKEKVSIPTYDADIICTSYNNEIIEDEEMSSKNIIYITLNDDNVVKVINQAINDSSMYNDSDLSLLSSIMDIYKDIDGIDAKFNKYDDSLVTEVTYEYDKIDLKLVKKELSNILDDNNILLNINKLPIKYETFKKYELEGFKCE